MLTIIIYGIMKSMKVSNKETIQCLECGKEFQEVPSLKRKFCCKECYYKSLTKNGEYRDFFRGQISKGKK